jgi:hypothetical protein
LNLKGVKKINFGNYQPIGLRWSVKLNKRTHKGQRAPDPDAFFKSLWDALVHAGMLVDDNRQHVELAPVTFSRAEVGNGDSIGGLIGSKWLWTRRL